MISIYPEMIQRSGKRLLSKSRSLYIYFGNTLYPPRRVTRTFLVEKLPNYCTIDQADANNLKLKWTSC